MKLAPFTLHRPDSVEQASRLLAELGDDGAAYCGGTELLLAMKLGLASYEHLVDLKRVRWEGPELSPGEHQLEFDFKYDCLGAATMAALFAFVAGCAKV